MNDCNTEFMTVNKPEVESSLTSSSGRQSKHMSGFKFPGCSIVTNERSFRIRKAKAWAAR